MRCTRTLFIFFLVAIVCACESDGVGTSDFSGTGQGGSMTRFAIQGSRMYILDNQRIKVYDIAQDNFEQINEVEVGLGLETIFAKGQYLYLGANDGMYIYSIENGDSPSFIFRYAHIVACDPVVVQGNRAYVTLRDGTSCNRGENALEIIDITNPYSPLLVRNYALTNPHGLGIDGNLLFICEGERGLDVYDITDEKNIKLKMNYDDFFAYDVIVRQGLATVTGEDGIFQVSYTNDSFQLLSKIPVARETR